MKSFCTPTILLAACALPLAALEEAAPLAGPEQDVFGETEQVEAGIQRGGVDWRLGVFSQSGTFTETLTAEPNTAGLPEISTITVDEYEETGAQLSLTAGLLDALPGLRWSLTLQASMAEMELPAATDGDKNALHAASVSLGLGYAITVVDSSWGLVQLEPMVHGGVVGYEHEIRRNVSAGSVNGEGITQYDGVGYEAGGKLALVYTTPFGLSFGGYGGHYQRAGSLSGDHETDWSNGEGDVIGLEGDFKLSGLRTGAFLGWRF